MHFGFNNQFIKVEKTRPIFQKFQTNYIYIYGVATLYVRRILDIKFFY
jgi:hypothetical protein